MHDYFSGSPVPAGRPSHEVPPPSAPWPPAWPTTPPPAPWGQPWQQPPPSSSALKTVLVVVAAVVGVVVVMGVLAAIAIPVFLNERGKELAARTSVTVPSTVDGMAPLTDAASRAYVKQLEQLPGPGTQVAGGYGDGRTSVFVGVGRAHLRPQDVDDYLAGATRRAVETAELPDLAFHEASAGALGGRMTCGSSAREGFTSCFFADAGSYGVVVVHGPVAGAERLADVARTSFVHRR